MAGQYILDTQRPDNELLLRIVPPLAAVVLLVTFVSLGLWQLDRAAEKEGLARMFANEAPYRSANSNETPAPFARIEIRGRYLDEQQILIDNIVRTSRLGFFVITPLELSPNEPLLLVNRGWVEKRRDTGEISADLSLSAERTTVRGRAGFLPRVAIRGGEAFAGSEDWPRIAVYPESEDVAEQLERDVLPWILLLAPEEPAGFRREWAPPGQSGPWTHYGYAIQWFAMAIALLIISGWQLRKRWLKR